MYHAAVSASLGPTREDKGLIPGDEARPADLYIPMWGPGARDWALDVCVTSPFQQATLERAAREPGYALALKKQQKWSKYGELCRAENIEFSALAVETSGGWEGDAEQIITKISRSLARAIGQEESDMTRHLFGKLSVLLMRSNASMIINRTSIHPLSSTYGGL